MRSSRLSCGCVSFAHVSAEKILIMLRTAQLYNPYKPEYIWMSSTPNHRVCTAASPSHAQKQY